MEALAPTSNKKASFLDINKQGVAGIDSDGVRNGVNGGGTEVNMIILEREQVSGSVLSSSKDSSNNRDVSTSSSSAGDKSTKYKYMPIRK